MVKALLDVGLDLRLNVNRDFGLWRGPNSASARAGASSTEPSSVPTTSGKAILLTLIVAAALSTEGRWLPVEVAARDGTSGGPQSL